jgi:DNA-binding response OmpR family regulator
MPKILIADDNKQIVSILSEYAKNSGFEVDVAYNGEEALEKALSTDYDMLLLDVMMPKKDGFEVCREIRKTSSLPIIMVTARGEDFERIMGLEIGADDYVVKPFSPGEVMARVNAVLRRISVVEDSESDKVFKYSDLTVDLESYTVKIAGEDVKLTKKEIELLWTLGKNKNKVFSRDNLLESIWGYDYFGDTRTVDSHIKRLRAKLEDCKHEDWDIVTIRGVGYKFEAYK